MRLIDADALHKEIVSQYGPQATPDGIMRSGVLNALHLIETTPTVDAEPVRHGKWIMRRDSKNLKTIATCSCCRYEHSYFVACNVVIDKMTYCPNCGTKMEEESDNG